jgi:hypothetical protein
MFRMMLATGALGVGFIPSIGGAQQDALFTWTGRAAPEVRITVQGTSLSATTLRNRGRNGNIQGRQGTSVGTARVQSALPQQNGTVSVSVNNDQAVATVLQQPSADNDYTAVIGVTDPNGRANQVRVTAYWTGASYSGRNGRPNRRGSNSEVFGGSGNFGTGTVRWAGDVDGTVELRLRGSQLTATKLTGKDLRNVGSGSGVTMPARPVNVSVRIQEGRGDVTVMQQPSSANGYTATIRVVDQPSGYGHYAFDIVWR